MILILVDSQNKYSTYVAVLQIFQYNLNLNSYCGALGLQLPLAGDQSRAHCWLGGNHQT